jgi:hypothetical protein
MLMRSRDRWLVFLLFVGTLISRVPFRSTYLYHWDSVNFALGLEHFDVRLHQPQPPGHFFYVTMGRIVNCLVQDANSTLVWISILFSSLMAVAIFYLCRAMFGRSSAIISSLFYISSPLIWFHSEIALSRIVAAFFSTAFAWVCYEMFQGKDRLFGLSAVLLGIIGGFRQQTLVLLLPLWFYVSFRRQAWYRIVVAAVVIVLITLSWLVPSMLLSGGWDEYWAANRGFAQDGLGQKSSFNSFSFLAVNLVRLGAFTTYGLLLGFIPLVYVLVSSIRRLSSLLHDRRVWFILIWAGPSFLLNAYWVEQPGHIFAFLPALLILVGPAICYMGKQLYRGKDIIVAVKAAHSVNPLVLGLGVAVIVANVVFFLLAPPFLFNVRSTVLSMPSWLNIRWRDRDLATRITFIEEHFSPQTTAVLASGLDFRHPDYYLRSYQYTSLSHELSTDPIELSSEIRHLVLFNDALVQENCSPERTNVLTMPNGSSLYYLEPLEGEQILVSLTEVDVR